MEAGNLNEWANGGGEFNSGGGDTTVSTAFAHTGTHSAKQTINTSGGSSGTRMFRWGEYRSLPVGQSATASVWVYIPAFVSIPQSNFNIYQFKSYAQGQPSSSADVFFQVNLWNRVPGALSLRVTWGCGANNPNQFPAGPFANSLQGSSHQCLDEQEEPRFVPIASVAIPVGQWFELKSQILPSSGFTGQFKFWLNGTLVWNLQNVRTGYANNVAVDGVDTQWAVNAYASGLSPSLYSHYIDDASITIP
jgi:Polysaccharide lyase